MRDLDNAVIFGKQYFSTIEHGFLALLHSGIGLGVQVNAGA
jgi:hypothetical protein